MPLQRRLPKRGFSNIFRVTVDEVNLDELDNVFGEGIVDVEAMRARGVVPRKATVVKVLGRGELAKSLTVRAHRFSRAARAKIEAAGGTVEIVPEPVPAPVGGAGVAAALPVEPEASPEVEAEAAPEAEAEAAPEVEAEAAPEVEAEAAPEVEAEAAPEVEAEAAPEAEDKPKEPE
jgi:hypothetical protein